VNFKVKIALSLAGFSEADIETIDKAIPSMERLLDAEKEFQPLLAKYYPDFAAVIPAAKIITAYAKGTAS
jgi:hypothetical protein